jgi:hypothetical protein
VREKLDYLINVIRVSVREGVRRSEVRVRMNEGRAEMMSEKCMIYGMAGSLRVITYQ